METAYNKSHSWGFVLDSDSLKKIYDRLFRECREIKIHAQCSGDISNTFLVIDDLLNYENYRDRKIISISFSDWPNFSIRLNTKSYRNIHLDFKGNENDVLMLKRDIEEILKGARPWWHFIAFFDFFLIGLCISTLILAGVYIAAAFGSFDGHYINPQKIQSLKEISISTIKANLILFGPVLIGILIEKSKTLLFPKGVFKIGQQKIVEENRNHIRRWLIGIPTSLTAIIFFFKEIMHFIK